MKQSATVGAVGASFAGAILRSSHWLAVFSSVSDNQPERGHAFRGWTTACHCPGYKIPSQISPMTVSGDVTSPWALAQVSTLTLTDSADLAIKKISRKKLYDRADIYRASPFMGDLNHRQVRHPPPDIIAENIEILEINGFLRNSYPQGSTHDGFFTGLLTSSVIESNGKITKINADRACSPVQQISKKRARDAVRKKARYTISAGRLN